MNARAGIEAEDPKRFLRQVASALRYEHPHPRVTRILTADDSYIHYEDALSGSPVVKTLVYSEKVPEASRADIGLRLLNAAYDYARSQHQYRIRVSIGTTHYERGDWTWDVDRNEDCELGNLVNVAKEGVTGASGMVRYITLESEGRGAFQHENVMALDPHGGLKLDQRPKAPHSIWTYQRKNEFGQPEPYHRVRTLPNGLSLEMFVAYRKDQAPTELLSLVKQYGPEVAKMALWATGDLAYALEDKGVTVVMPMPSSKPLAKRLARLLANRLNVRFEDRISKTASIRHVPISKRKAVAARLYSVSGRFKNEVVCLVDDYIVTSASMMAAALHAYSAGARKVIGAALAI